MTQYVGLTNAAKEFVRDFEKIESDNKTTGMFDEDVPLGCWKSPDGKIYKEVLEYSPWSSGPMLFTCLKQILVDGAGEKDDVASEMFQWVVDPTVKGECDLETGRMWV